MGKLISIFKKQRIEEDEFVLEGLKFTPVNNKTLRLYFERQFSNTKDYYEEEDIPYINHIFELKVKLFYNSHYDKSNLINFHNQLQKDLDKYPGKGIMKDLVIEESDETDPFLLELCHFNYFTTEPDFDIRYKCLKLNENLKIKDNIFENINNLSISEMLIDQIKTTDSVDLFIRQNRNPIFFLFAIKKIIEPYATNIHKIKIYQVNFSIIDQDIYVMLADFLKDKREITIIKLIGKTIEEIAHKNHFEFSQTNTNSRQLSQMVSCEESQFTKKTATNKNLIHYNYSQLDGSSNLKGLNLEEEKPITDYEKAVFSKHGRKSKQNKKKIKTINSAFSKVDNSSENNFNTKNNFTNPREIQVNPSYIISSSPSNNINKNNEINLNIEFKEEEKLQEINSNGNNINGMNNNELIPNTSILNKFKKKNSNLKKRRNNSDGSQINENDKKKNADKYVSIQNNAIESNSGADQNNEQFSLKTDSFEENTSNNHDSEDEESDEEEDFNNLGESSSNQINDEALNFRSENLNKSNFILFYEVLAKRKNLLELSCLVYLRENHLVLISHVLHENKLLRKLNLRNMFSNPNANDNELDIAFHVFNSLGANLKDEIYILFNEINQLNFLEKLKLTHFSFNSDINYLACQSALQLPNLKCLDLKENQGIINNYLNVEENYNLVKSNLKKINFGNVYFHMIRNFDLIIHPEKLKVAEMGVFDSISLSAFLHYCNNTQLEKIKIRLNKPCGIDTLELLLKILANHIFLIKNLKYFYMKNTYTDETYSKYQDLIREWVQKLFYEKFQRSKNIRKISLNHQKRATYIVNDRMYLKENNIIIRFLILYVLEQKFKSNFEKVHEMFLSHINCYPDKKHYYQEKFSTFKENILKKIILLESGKPKKLTL